MGVVYSRNVPANVLVCVASFLPCNDVPCNFRLINKAARDAISILDYKIVRLSQPVPHHAFCWCFSSESTFPKNLNYKARIQVLRLVASSGDLDNLQVAIERIGMVYFVEVMEAAAAAGHLHICSWLRQQGWGWGDALEVAARAGRRDVCEWMLDRGFKAAVFGLSGALEAARHGHVDLMDWLLQQYGGRVPCPEFLGVLAEGSDLATLKARHATWLPAPAAEGALAGARLTPFEQKFILAGAARSPNPDWRAKLEWLEGQGYPKVRGCCTAVAALPDALNRLTWLRQRGYPLDQGAVEGAAGAGNITTLEYLLGETGMISEDCTDASTAAASDGHLAALQLLHARGCPLDQDCIRQAAEGGHLAAVAWLLEVMGLEVAELDPEVMVAAAKSGNVELLAWLHERGAPLDEVTLRAAAYCGGEAALEWVVQAGCPWPVDGSLYFSSLGEASKLNLGTSRAMRRLGCPWGEQDFLSYSIRLGCPLPFLRWLLAEGCPVDWQDAVLMAAEERELGDKEEVAAWLREQAAAAGVVLCSVSDSDSDSDGGSDGGSGSSS